MKQLTYATILAGTILLFGCPTAKAKKCTGIADCPITQICSMGECRGGLAGGPGGGAPGTGGGSGGGVTDDGGTGGGGTGTGAGGGPSGGGGGLIEPDAGPNPDYDGGCGPPVPGNPTIRRLCAPATMNECDTNTDTALMSGNVPSARLNAQAGNGFDDDCDGQVDEGCFCPANGVTKDCYLVPATQVSDLSGLPVGWCTNNAKGSLDCAGGELATWSGVCRGAQPPALTDSCGAGDYNCDGLSGNNAAQGCMCPNNVQCPSNTITLSPYPDPTSIPRIDGSLWVDSAQRANTTNWTWTVLGGDCDNVLPNPTFAIYNTANSTTSGARRGTRTGVRLDATQTPARYVPQASSPLIALRAEGYGNGIAGGQVYPAFGLSGDYIVQGEFTLDGQSFSCTQKVQVRAPGVRAELCWDTVGGRGGVGGNDIDLHFARLQGTTCTTHGWNAICSNPNGSVEDCYYHSSSGCANGATAPGWGYLNSAASACRGWSSKRTSACTNPRLDLDNVVCDRAITDPTSTSFCGPENINLDNPMNNDAFVVGVNHYGTSGAATAKPHVNLYCNGERVLSVGYNPATGQNAFPLLNTPGDDATGDFWTVATIRANVMGGNLTSCTVSTVPSRTADPTRDGPGNPGNDICVDNGYATKNFVDNGTGQGLTQGALPMTPSQWCKH